MKHSNITDLVSRMTPPRDTTSEDGSLTLVKLSIKLFELANVMNSVIDSVFKIAGTSLGKLLEDYEKDPKQCTCDLIEELHPHVERLEFLAREKIDEIKFPKDA